MGTGGGKGEDTGGGAGKGEGRGGGGGAGKHGARAGAGAMTHLGWTRQAKTSSARGNVGKRLRRAARAGRGR